MRARVRVPLTAAVVLALAGAAHGQFYKYTIIAKVGQANLTGMGDGPSINNGTANNNVPLVAFTGQTTGSPDEYEGVFVGDGMTDPVNISESLTANDQNLSATCQINELGTVAIRWTSPNPNGPTYTHLWTFNWADPDNGIKFADSVAQNPFRAINTEVTINNAGKIVWSGLDQDVKKILATGVWKSYKTAQLVTTPVRPIFADNDDFFVLRKGNSPTDSIQIRDLNLGVIEDIATSTNFSALGQSPGISADGQIVIFTGTLTQGGATALNAAQSNWVYGPDEGLALVPLDPGPGVFASYATSIGRVIVRIAGEAGNGILDPGEFYIDLDQDGLFDSGSEQDQGPCSSFSFPDMRVSVDGSIQDQRAVTVCYAAADLGGHQGLYTNRLVVRGTGQGFFDPNTPGILTVGQTTTVVRTGQNIPGLGVVESLGIYDPLNARDRGDVAFYAKTAGSAGIVRARPQQVVFLDFDAINNYVLNNDSAGLFKASGVPVGWNGDMAMVFAFNAPNRDDLNSPSALKTIQDGIVDYVQEAFDHLVPGGPGANVKVFGRVGESAPEGGPFVRVSIGDGGHSDDSPDGLNGISDFDIFNEKVSWDLHDVNNTPKRGQVVLGGPLIFVDNMFRANTGNFTNGDVNNPETIPLSDTGPHKITQQQVIWAIGGTAAHETGHNLGLGHIDDDLHDLLMNCYSGSCLSGDPVDEKRLKRHFGMGTENLEPSEFPTGSVNSAGRLALSVGSDSSPAVLPREQPPGEELWGSNRHLLDLSVDLNQSVNVAAAGIGIAPGRYDAAPRFIDLGSGDLETLLNRQIEIGPGDSVIVFASTKGQGIDIFGVKAGFGGDVGEIELKSALAVMSDSSIRCSLTDNNNDPLKQAMDIYQRKDNGDMALLGSIGDPGGNAGPLAKDDTAQSDGGPVVISILANDTDADGLDKGSIVIVYRTPSGGVEVDPAAGKVTYRPVKGFDGVDEFRYTVRDTKGAISNEATVTVTVAGGGCYADFTGDGTLDLFDFLGFVNAFNAQDQSADCIDDNTFDLFDFLCFVNAFNGGC
jgi:hypothetical protein